MFEQKLLVYLLFTESPQMYVGSPLLLRTVTFVKVFISDLMNSHIIVSFTNH